MIRRERSLVALICACLSAMCGPTLRYTSAPLGNYDMYRPFTYVTRNVSLEIELARAAYVSVISVNADPDRPGVPVIFAPWYPANEGEESFLSAGRHRVRHAPPPDLAPRNCTVEEKPSLMGCRRPARYYGRIAVISARLAYNHMVVVTQSPVDPYELADDLYHATRDNPKLDRLLRAYDAEAAAPALEQALLDRRGPIVLAGVYITLRLTD